MYRFILVLGILITAFSILMDLIINYLFFNVDLYGYADNAWSFFVINVLVDCCFWFVFIIYANKHNYFLLIPMALIVASIDCYYSYLIYLDVTNFEILKNSGMIDFYYFLSSICIIAFSLLLLYSKSKNDATLFRMGIYLFVATIFMLVLGHFEAFMFQYIMGYFFPFISLFYIRVYLNEFGKNNFERSEILDIES